MKSALAFCLLLVSVQLESKLTSSKPIDESEYWNTDKEICVKDLNLNRAKIKALDEEEIAVENDVEFNTFAYCFFVKSGIQSLKGEIKYDKIRQLFEDKINLSYDDVEYGKFLKKIARDAVTNCEKYPPEANNPGQLTVKVGNCIMNNIKTSIQTQV